MLRELGFSHTDARRLRDQSQTNIEVVIVRERRRISRKSVSQRTPKETARLNRLRDTSTPPEVEKRTRRLKTRGNRWQDFSDWSSRHKGGFPEWALQEIRRFNEQAGLPTIDGFGYRQFFFWYVERLPIMEAAEFADRDDSGIRHEMGIPLRRR